MEQVLTKIALKTETQELRDYIVKCKTDIIKWMFVFWIGQIVAILAIAMLVLHK